jgi:predicted RNase H-like HicB family nuclease
MKKIKRRIANMHGPAHILPELWDNVSTLRADSAEIPEMAKDLPNGRVMVDVLIEKKRGGFVATVKQMPEILLVGDTEEDIRQQIPDALAAVILHRYKMPVRTDDIEEADFLPLGEFVARTARPRVGRSRPSLHPWMFKFADAS